MTKRRRFAARDFILYFAIAIPAFSLMCFCFMPDYFRVIFTVDRWRTATARVDSTEVQYSPLIGLLNKHYRYEPLVHYHFDVNGVTYTGSHIMLPSGERWQSEARYDLKAYHSGQKIQVFYDPAAPGRGAINKPSYICLYLAIGAILLIMSFTMINVYFYQRKQSPPTHEKK